MKNYFSRKFIYTISIIVVFAVIIILLLILKNTEAKDLMKDIKAQSIDVSNSITEQYINSTQAFSINLFKNCYKSGENILISPTSAILALGMAANGADGETLKEFKKALGQSNMFINDLNKACKAYSNELLKKQGNTVLDIYNSAWIRRDFDVNHDFLQANADFFNTETRTLDFDDKLSSNVINKWVKEKTDGKIESIVEKINKDDVMFLTNALNFEARWLNPFNTNQAPSSKTFYLANGKGINTTFMNLQASINNTVSRDESAVLLPYDDDRFAFLCIMPDKKMKIQEYISQMSQGTINYLLKNMKKTELMISLPPFKTYASYEFKDALRNMGLKTAFDGERADFSKMSPDSNGLYISSVKQSTFLQVDALGTKAGTATSVEMTKGLVAKSIVFNRPFVYAVIDTKTWLPLFLGVMQVP